MRNVWIAAGLGAFFLFLLGIWFGVGRLLGGEPANQGTIAQGKPTLEEARRTPTPEPWVPPPGASRPPGPRREPSPEVSLAWVIQDGAPAHQSPAPSAPKLYSLRYGDKVRPMESKGDWDRVLLPDGRPAWVQHQFLSARQPADATSAADGEAGAVKQVNAFYEDLGARRLGPAYDRLSFEWKRQLDFTTFSEGYRDISQVAATVGGVTPVDAQRVQVQVEVQAWEGRTRRVYAGTHLVVREKGDWKLDSGDLKDVTPPPSDPEEEELE